MKFELMTNRQKVSLGIEILVRGILSALLLPYTAYFIVVSPDLIVTPLIVLLAIAVGFPFGLMGRWVWKWQFVALLVLTVTIVVTVGLREEKLIAEHHHDNEHVSEQRT